LKKSVRYVTSLLFAAGLFTINLNFESIEREKYGMSFCFLQLFEHASSFCGDFCYIGNFGRTDSNCNQDFNLLQDIFQGRLQLGAWITHARTHSEYNHGYFSCFRRLADSKRTTINEKVTENASLKASIVNKHKISASAYPTAMRSSGIYVCVPLN